MLSKKLENLEHAIARHFKHWNFRQFHQLLRITAAMIAGVSGHVCGLAYVGSPIHGAVQTSLGEGYSSFVNCQI